MAKPLDSNQMLFFPLDPRKYAENLGLNWWAIKKLYDDGWLSFDPETTKITSSGLEAEFTFLCHLVAAGCEPPLLEKLLSKLKKPYAYSFSEIYYDWRSKSWESFPTEKSARDTINEFIEQSIEDQDKDELYAVQDLIESALAEIETSEYGLGLEEFDVDPKADSIIVSTLKLFKNIEKSLLLPDKEEDQHSLVRIMDAFEGIPMVYPGSYEKVTLSGAVVKEEGWEVTKWWEFEIEESGAIRVGAHGFARSPETGGDSFTSLIWELTPGLKPSIMDHSEYSRVPGVLPFAEEMDQIDLDKGYELDFYESE